MLLEPLVSTIETIKVRIATHGGVLRQNETRTRAALIDPLLQALGWDTTDPGLVTPEYRVDIGWADYALLGVGNQPVAVIEAKRLGSIVENHLEQAVGYCIQQGIAYAGVTDGSHWQLYRTFEPVPLADKLVLDVSIADAPAHETALKLLLLWRPNLAPGQLVEANASVLVNPAEPQLATISSSQSVATLPNDQSVPAQQSGRWTRLSEIRNVVGSPSPSAIRFSSGQPRPIGPWWQVFHEVAEWLVQRGTLTADKLPIVGIASINSSPFGPSGKPFEQPKQVSGSIYIRAKQSSETIVKSSTLLLQHFRIDPSTVELQTD